jgi:hypothetical protein
MCLEILKRKTPGVPPARRAIQKRHRRCRINAYMEECRDGMMTSHPTQTEGTYLSLEALFLKPVRHYS